MEIFQMSHSFGFSFSERLWWVKVDMSILYHVDQQMTLCTKCSVMRGREEGIATQKPLDFNALKLHGQLHSYDLH